MSVNGTAIHSLRRCDLCNNHAVATMLDGTVVCADCAPQARRDDFDTFAARVRWFHRQWRNSTALPLWWVLWRFAQVEYRLRR